MQPLTLMVAERRLRELEVDVPNAEAKLKECRRKLNEATQNVEQAGQELYASH